MCTPTFQHSNFVAAVLAGWRFPIPGHNGTLRRHKFGLRSLAMEIRFEEKNFQILDACPIDAPKDRIPKRHLREHGMESLLNSKKLSQFSGCILG